MTMTTADSYAAVISQRVTEEQRRLAAQWLDRLKDILSVDCNDVFPSADLLDHIPLLVGEVAAYLRAPADEEIAANAAVIAKARELGMLRHAQHASVHQLLREYEILSEILEAFVAQETRRLDLQPTSEECFDVLQRLTRSTRALMRTTVDTFVSEYTSTIQERNERINTFHRMASHEMRSPIGTVLFAAGVLSMDAVQSDPHRVAKVAATVRANAERLSWLVDNLQRLARLGERVDVPSQQRVEVTALANEVARQIDEMAASRGVTIRIDSRLPTLWLDPARLELVLMNLVSNGIKYSDPSKPECFVEIARYEGAASPNQCTFVVRDNGLGIREEDQHAIFDRFFRAHAHLDGEHGVSGTGLGLAIVAECVNALGGTIRCESAVGAGTTFFVHLPNGNGSDSAAPVDADVR